jgi:hypothetical protein
VYCAVHNLFSLEEKKIVFNIAERFMFMLSRDSLTRFWGMFFGVILWCLCDMSGMWHDMGAPYLELTTIQSSFGLKKPHTVTVRSYKVRKNKQELQIVVNSKYKVTMPQSGTTKVAAESLIAQINSQCKLATVCWDEKIKKILYEIKVSKVNEHAPEGVVMWYLSNYTKNIPQSLVRLSH